MVGYDEGGGIACSPVGRGCVVSGNCGHACVLQTWIVVRLVIYPFLPCFLPGSDGIVFDRARC
uniref:Uncharacterized protein n=1 Tax=Arundo donax TaxID=35708 RepID=A0A0A9DF54_ARUDO